MSIHRLVVTVAALGVIAGATATCTNANLEPIPPPEEGRADNKLTVEGRFCTTDPDDLAFPVKLLFVVDESASMDATDPDGTRTDALVEVVNAVFDVPGVEIGIIGFGLGVTPHTEKCDVYGSNGDDGIAGTPDDIARVNCRPGFAPPDQALLGALETGEAAGTTDFLGTLNSVIAFLADDMGQSDPLALQNARYAIIFLSDGLPDADGSFDPIGTCRDAADWERAGKTVDNAGVVSAVGDLLEQIEELARQYDVRELTFNAAFAAAPQTQAPIKACGSTFMRAMAKQGKGVFRDFSSGEAINFLFIDFTSFKRIFAMKSFLAANLSAAPFSLAIGVDPTVQSDDPTLARGIIDSDADGLPDEQEKLIGTDPEQQDTDGDGFSDLLEHRLTLSGLDPLDPTDADCGADVDKGDFDGDGLRDCEERFFGTNVRGYDTDNDGFGDGVEAMFGLNPAIDDTLFDVDFDGVRNSNELRAHSRVDNDDVIALSEHAYRYRIVEDGLEGSSLCYTFTVDNIALATTTGARDTDNAASARGLLGGGMLANENRILFEVTEEPFDAPGEPGVARIACARARFNAGEQLRDPANGTMTLPPEAFVPANEFNPETDCIDP
jgi:hypothetical protein